MKKTTIGTCAVFVLIALTQPSGAQLNPGDVIRFGNQVIQQMPDRQLPRQAQARLGRAEFKEIQRLLNELGYDAGPVDGAPGRRTMRAIATFQRDAGLAVTGRADASLLSALRTPPRQSPEPAPAEAQFTMLRGVDLPGNDYRNGLNDPALKGISERACLALCSQDGRCRAYTYNTQVSVCILKDGVAGPQPTPIAISGIKNDHPEPPVRQADAPMRQLNELPGEIEVSENQLSTDGGLKAGLSKFPGVMLRDGRVVASSGGGYFWFRGGAAEAHTEALRYALMRLAFTRFPDLWDEPAFAFSAIWLVDKPVQARILQNAGVDPADLDQRSTAYRQYQQNLDEFAQRALLTAIRAQLPPIIEAAAPSLPIPMFLPCRIRLNEYDFERELFPIRRSRQDSCANVQFAMGGNEAAIFGYNPDINITAPIPVERLVFDIPVAQAQARDFRANLYAGSGRRADEPDALKHGALGIEARLTDIVDAGSRHGSRFFTFKVEVENSAIYRADDLSQSLMELDLVPVPSVAAISANPKGPAWATPDTLNVVIGQTGAGDNAKLAALARHRARVESHPGQFLQIDDAWDRFFPRDLVSNIGAGKPVPDELLNNFAEWQKARVARPPETIVVRAPGPSRGYASDEGAGPSRLFQGPSSSYKRQYEAMSEHLGVPVDRLVKSQMTLDGVADFKNYNLWLVLPSSIETYRIKPEIADVERGWRLNTRAELRIIETQIVDLAGKEKTLVFFAEPVGAEVAIERDGRVLGRASYSKTFAALAAEEAARAAITPDIPQISTACSPTDFYLIGNNAVPDIAGKKLRIASGSLSPEQFAKVQEAWPESSFERVFMPTASIKGVLDSGQYDAAIVNCKSVEREADHFEKLFQDTKVAIVVPATVDVAPAEAPKAESTWDIAGITLGLSVEEAERMVREKMPVGRVLDLDKEKAKSYSYYRDQPFAHFKMFVREDGDEYYLLYTAEADSKEIVGIARTIHIRGGASTKDLLALMKDKYGDPLDHLEIEHFEWAEFGGASPDEYSHSGNCGAQIRYGLSLRAFNIVEGDGAGGRIINDTGFVTAPRIQVYGGSTGRKSPHDPSIWSACGPTIVAQINNTQAGVFLSYALIDLSSYASKYTKALSARPAVELPKL